MRVWGLGCLLPLPYCDKCTYQGCAYQMHRLEHTKNMCVKRFFVCRVRQTQKPQQKEPCKRALQKSPTKEPYKRALQKSPAKEPCKRALQKSPTKEPHKHLLHIARSQKRLAHKALCVQDACTQTSAYSACVVCTQRSALHTKKHCTHMLLFGCEVLICVRGHVHVHVHMQLVMLCGGSN